jgi:hypothetical protein
MYYAEVQLKTILLLGVNIIEKKNKIKEFITN